MAYAHYERLSAMDLSFLAMEDGKAHMHIGSVSIFEAGPLRKPDGGLDFERVLAFIDAQLHKVPRFRQKLAWVPGFGQPVWIDDARFNLLYHVRHTALPPPGDMRQLKRMTGRILSQEFDRGKPLWEYWFVDGLEGDRFALVAKVHHCMADGISGVAIGKLLVGTRPDYEPPPARPWLPRPAPTGSQLFAQELRHRAIAPFSLLRSSRPEGERPPEPVAAVGGGLRRLIENAWSAAGGTSQTPLNVEVGPHRRFDGLRLPLDALRRIGSRAGGKLNDVVLALASGALRSFLQRRGVDVDDLDFRALVPVSVRSEAEQGSLGNRVSGMLTRLPLDEKDPWQRLLRVVETTHELKASGQSGAMDRVIRAADLLLPAPLLGALFRAGAHSSVANIVITNVPGAQAPVYLLGARQLETYPVVPLVGNQALGIALMSYDGNLYWGLNADWDVVPDLHDLVESVRAGFEELAAATLPVPPADPPRAEQSA